MTRKARNNTNKKPIKSKGIFRSIYEKDCSVYMNNRFKDNWNYESEKLNYTIPETHHIYTPDFIINYKNYTFYVETKGVLDLDTRKKMIYVRDSNPDKIFIFIFQNKLNKLNKKSKTTYEKWANKNGFYNGEIQDLRDIMDSIIKERIDN